MPETTHIFAFHLESSVAAVCDLK